MRTVVVMSSLLLVGFAFMTIVPTTTAVGVCTGVKDAWCDSLVCVGYRHDSTGFHCQREVPWPCDPCPYP